MKVEVLQTGVFVLYNKLIRLLHTNNIVIIFNAVMLRWIFCLLFLLDIMILITFLLTSRFLFFFSYFRLGILDIMILITLLCTITKLFFLSYFSIGLFTCMTVYFTNCFLFKIDDLVFNTFNLLTHLIFRTDELFFKTFHFWKTRVLYYLL